MGYILSSRASAREKFSSAFPFFMYLSSGIGRLIRGLHDGKRQALHFEHAFFRYVCQSGTCGHCQVIGWGLGSLAAKKLRGVFHGNIAFALDYDFTESLEAQ